MSDTATQLGILRAQRDASSDPALRAALDAAIAALEKASSSEGSSSGDTITVGTLSQVTGAAFGAGARATVYIDGRQGKTNDALLAAYYQRLITRCQHMPLQGIYEQRSGNDMLSIALEQIYTQLATTNEAQRECFDAATLLHFDAEGFLKQHVGDRYLPADQRSRVQQGGIGRESFEFPLTFGGERRSLQSLPGVDLVALAQHSQELAFFGPQMVSEAMSAESRLVLLGEPGSSKSTALRYLSYVLAQAGLNDDFDLSNVVPGWTLGRLLPVFVPFLPFAQQLAQDATLHGNAADLWNYLAEQLQPKGANAGLATAVHEELEAGRVLLLLDGLDEVAGTDSSHKVICAVRSFAERYPTSRIVITCRIRAYEGERNQPWQLPGWPTATMADWTLGQMLAFVGAWYRTVAALQQRSETWRDDRIASLSRAVQTRDDLQRFGRQPLMMTIMALVHLNDGRLPEERATLYGRCIDLLLGQWEIAGKEASAYGTLMDYIGLPDSDVQSLRPVLSKAAYEAHRAAARGEVGRLSRAVLRTMVDDELRRRTHPDASTGADRFLDYTDLRAGLIQASDAGDAYSFPHQTFQEYLAGIELVSGINPLTRILRSAAMIAGGDRFCWVLSRSHSAHWTSPSDC